LDGRVGERSLTETVPGVRLAEPQVRLVAHTRNPFQLAVAAARTCYASEFVFVGRLGPKGERTRTTLEAALPACKAQLEEIGGLDTPHERRIQLVEAIARDVGSPDLASALQAFADLARQRAQGDAGLARAIYEAGHHTPFQHPTFVFSLEDVSRNVVESFFHNHTFYNSEQQSQRYVEMKRAEVHAPESVRANPEALQVFEKAVGQAWTAYHDLRQRLVLPNLRVMASIGKIKGQADAEVHKEAEKKAQEMARYVLPIAATTQLYHTVSGIVLLRYIRMCAASSAPAEARAVVDLMVKAVRAVDPSFIDGLRETRLEREDLVEWTLLAGAGTAQPPEQKWFQARRNAELDVAGDKPVRKEAFRHSVLVASEDPGKQVEVVLDAIAAVTGAPRRSLLPAVMDPARNPLWNDTLNTWDHSPVLRALHHVHFTFRKRLSLSAFAQDQRHRLTPASRPMLQRCLTPEPDVYTPDVIASDAEAEACYARAVEGLWGAMRDLRRLGIPDEDACYLLPNCTNLYFLQSGDLLSLIHKWRLRLCFNAQKEIFDASLEELRQVQRLVPRLTRWVGPPCVFVAAGQPADKQDSVEACCPEASWCGVKVWRTFNAAKGVPKRPY
jgi:flavin-dependent thymidylate synthase